MSDTEIGIEIRSLCWPPIAARISSLIQVSGMAHFPVSACGRAARAPLAAPQGTCDADARSGKLVPRVAWQQMVGDDDGERELGRVEEHRTVTAAMVRTDAGAEQRAFGIQQIVHHEAECETAGAVVHGAPDVLALCGACGQRI